MHKLQSQLCLSVGAIPVRWSFFLSCQYHSLALDMPRKNHAYVIKSGMLANIYEANKLLTLYGKIGELPSADQLFDEMPFRDIILWNVLIGSSVNHKLYSNAFLFMKIMRNSGFLVDEYTLGSMLKGAAGMNSATLGSQLHCLIMKVGLFDRVHCACALLDMYAKCGMIEDSENVFELISYRNVVTWNAMIGGYSLARDYVSTFQFLKLMETEGYLLGDASIASTLSLLEGPEFYSLVRQIHVKVIKYGKAVSSIAHNALLAAYADCGSIWGSERLFYCMKSEKDSVTWNSMLASYVQNNCWALAIELFCKMRNLGMAQDIYTYTSIISACFDKEREKMGKALHALVIMKGLENEIPVSNSIISMYVKSSCDMMQDAVRYFDQMELKDDVSWNSILTGLSQIAWSDETFNFFARMRHVNVGINQYSFSALLRASSDLAVMQLGQQVHGLVIKFGFEQNNFVTSPLMFMYSKCAVIESSKKVFIEATKSATIIWNSLIFVYAQHGLCKLALEIFDKMQKNEVTPDHITFVGLLSACSHIGLVEEGMQIFSSMNSLYGVSPRLEHYACGVDLLGRAGYLYEAKALIESMPFTPDAMVWKSLLGACRIHGNLELATYAANNLVVLDPHEHSTYVILSDLYARKGKWTERASIKMVMRDKGMSKVPGCSWIEVKNNVYAFNAEYRSHPQADEIYNCLRSLGIEMSRLGYVPLDMGHEEDFDWT